MENMPPFVTLYPLTLCCITVLALMLCNARLASKVSEWSLVPQPLFPAAKGVFLDSGVNLAI